MLAVVFTLFVVLHNIYAQECIKLEDCLPLNELRKFQLESIENGTINKFDLNSYLKELSCGVNDMEEIMVKCPEIEGM